MRLAAILLVAAALVTTLGCAETERVREERPRVEAPPQMVEVPELAKLTAEEASDLLSDAGLSIGKVDEQPSEMILAGTVMSQEPRARARTPEGSAVGIVLSKGPTTARPLVSVPNVLGMDASKARDILVDARLRTDQSVTCNLSDPDASGVPAGKVYRQLPAAGLKAPEGTQVQIRYWAESA